MDIIEPKEVINRIEDRLLTLHNTKTVEGGKSWNNK